MVSLFNAVWFIFPGVWIASAFLVLSALFSLTIVGIPIGKACFEFAKLSAFPYGKEIIRETELKGIDGVSRARIVGGQIVNILWLPFGLLLAFAFFLMGIAAYITIVGIPCGVVFVRMSRFVITPIGAKVVTTKQAYASAVANELDRRNLRRNKAT
jgi:uncharacterized membrane protein YccF (DUF307 family)